MLEIGGVDRNSIFTEIVKYPFLFHRCIRLKTSKYIEGFMNIVNKIDLISIHVYLTLTILGKYTTK